MAESVETVRTRAEDRLSCPRCGRNGNLRRIGGGNLASRFRCEASDYPRRWCGFTFVVTDRELSKVLSR